MILNIEKKMFKVLEVSYSFNVIIIELIFRKYENWRMVYFLMFSLSSAALFGFYVELVVIIFYP